jgi:regulator of replication initiation timing
MMRSTKTLNDLLNEEIIEVLKQSGRSDLIALTEVTHHLETLDKDIEDVKQHVHEVEHSLIRAHTLLTEEVSALHKRLSALEATDSEPEPESIIVEVVDSIPSITRTRKNSKVYKTQKCARPDCTQHLTEHQIRIGNRYCSKRCGASTSTKARWDAAKAVGYKGHRVPRQRDTIKQVEKKKSITLEAGTGPRSKEDADAILRS